MRFTLASILCVLGSGWVMTEAEGASTREVQLIVITPASAADPEEIFASFNIHSWQPGGRRLARVAPGVFELTLKLPADLPLEYKFTRSGTWETVEKQADRTEVTNRKLVVPAAAGTLVVVHRVQRWADEAPAGPKDAVFQGPLTVQAAASAPATAPSTAPRAGTRTGRIDTLEIASPQLNNRRTVLVYLPPGYDEQSERRYPVLYMHDGNNVFDAATSFAGVEWSADETAEQLIKSGEIQPVILVAIYNNADRMSEYTPATEPGRGGGNADKYLAFLADTVKPLIDRSYRTKPDREHTALAGSSLGGVISLYGVIKHPEVFGAAGVISPALWWANKDILARTRAAEWSKPPRLWIDVGTKEGDDATSTQPVGRYVATCRELVEILRAKKLRSGLDFEYVEEEGGTHHESAWARRFPQVLRFLFPANDGPAR